MSTKEGFHPAKVRQLGATGSVLPHGVSAQLVVVGDLVVDRPVGRFRLRF